MGKYDDIIGLSHHVSAKRPQMSMADRAAQFSPFAALTGFDAAIAEEGRLTDARITLDENELDMLDMKFRQLVCGLELEPEVEIRFFVPDERKDGGAYQMARGVVRKIDMNTQRIVMAGGEEISMQDVFDIQFV